MPYHLKPEDIKAVFEACNLPADRSQYFFNLANLDKVMDPAKKYSLLDDGLTPEQIIMFAYRKNINHVLQNSVQPLTEKISKLDQISKNTSLFFDDTFTFFNNNSGTHKIIFDSRTPRESIINLAFHRLQIDMYATRSENLRRALEEMIMNAQFDAKNLADGKPDSKSHVILEKGENVVAVTVIDHYGALVFDKFLARIESCFSIGIAASINQSRQAGAGIGSVIIFNAADSLYLGCIPGQKTRITAIIPYNLSEKKQETLQKSIVLV